PLRGPTRCRRIGCNRQRGSGLFGIPVGAATGLGHRGGKDRRCSEELSRLRENLVAAIEEAERGLGPLPEVGGMILEEKPKLPSNPQVAGRLTNMMLRSRAGLDDLIKASPINLPNE